MMFGWVVGGVLALAVGLAWLRLWRGRGRRHFLWLMALQPLVAGLLWLALFPPPVAMPLGTLVVAGRGAPAGTYDVRLPEAGGSVSGELVPDLATALRGRGATRVRLVGEGLEPRDVAALEGIGLTFAPPPLSRGLVRIGVDGLGVDGPVAVGGDVRVYGVAAGLKGGRALLFDPAGRQVAGVALDADGGFALSGTVRAGGGADWQLRLRDAGGAEVERAVVPVVATQEAPVRLWVRAGAPGAELKYVQRWALDAGLRFGSDVALGAGVGAGVRTGDGLLLTAAGLRGVDVLVLDERSWAGLSGGARGAVLAAVRGGMGLVLRVTGPVPAAVRRDWARLGLALGETVREVRLAEGRKVQAVGLLASDAVPWLRDAGGAAVAVWQPLGRGRVALWPVQDAFALVLAGEPAAFAGLWSRMVSVVARPAGTGQAALPGWGFVGERADVCGAGDGASMLAPDGREVGLLPDGAAAGCAGYWPAVAGWHRLRLKDGAEQWLRVLDEKALPGVRAAARRDTALLLANDGGDDAQSLRDVPGQAWPWWLAFVGFAGLLWWLERRR